MRTGILTAVLVAGSLRARIAGADAPANTNPANPTHDKDLDAAEADEAVPEAKRTPWNEFDLRLFTVRVGAGLLIDHANFFQNEASTEQLPSLSPAWKLRDFRILLKGKFAFAPDRLSYTLGYMYDGAAGTWHVRQTGLMLTIPELNGQLFVGRTKEGFSTSKIMTGYFGWTLERSAANDAFLPILADGVKWTGRTAANHVVYNAGYFIDTWSETESFNKNDQQFAARVVGLPLPLKSNTVLHLAGEIRFAGANDGMVQYRSKPESFIAQDYAVDTGKFAAQNSITYGAEAYLRPGSLTLGSEYYWNKVNSSETHNPLFQGGDIFAAYLLTGEVHPYNDRGAFFEAVTPSRPVTSGGPGAWEIVVRYSRVDLDSGTIDGGKFWRVTPMVNWYASQNVRFEAAYGYGKLDRFGLDGATQFLQLRLQFVVM